jgi:hypothetical protein
MDEFCKKCGCQKDEYFLNSDYCEQCLGDWADENEVYL